MPRSRSPIIGNLIQLGNVPSGGGGSAPVTAAGSLQATFTNGDGVSHTAGMVLYLSADNTLRKAIPNGTLAQAQAYAIAISTVLAGATGLYVILGQATGLAGGVFGSVGYLATTSLITTVVPSTPGQYVVELGMWQSAIIFGFEPLQPFGPL